MTQVAEHTDRAQYQADIDTLAAADTNDTLSALRDAGAEKFSEMDFPHYKEEAWRHTNIKPILKSTFRTHIGASSASVTTDDLAAHSYTKDGLVEVVLVDGIFSSELSSLDTLPDGVVISSLATSEASMDQLGELVNYTNAFVALNTALVQDGVCITVEKNTQVDVAVHILYVTTGQANTATHPRNVIVAGESSEFNVIESYVGLNDESETLTNGVCEIVVGDNAKVTRHKVVSEGASAHHLMTTQVTLGRDSRFNAFAMTLSGQTVRNELCVKMTGPGGHCDLNGLYLNDGDRVIDNALFVEHASAKCYSRMGYKGVLDGNSTANFTGMVLVPQDSQQTDSDQLNNNLLLSDKAVIDTKPQLEIFADDVKCTHGATIGAFPPELIFYFQSRGMDPLTAHGILTYGFAAEVVDAIEVEPLKERLADYVFTKYSPK